MNNVVDARDQPIENVPTEPRPFPSWARRELSLARDPAEPIPLRRGDQAPWQRLYFLPEPQGQGSLRPTRLNFPDAASAVSRCW